MNNIRGLSKTHQTLIFISKNNEISHQLTENISCDGKFNFRLRALTSDK